MANRVVRKCVEQPKCVTSWQGDYEPTSDSPVVSLGFVSDPFARPF